MSKNRVEQNARTMTETARTIVSGLSYHVLPEKLTAELFVSAVTAISIRPSYDTGRYPHEHVTKRKIGVKTVALYPFGHVCQTKTITTPSDARPCLAPTTGLRLDSKLLKPSRLTW